MHERPYHSAHTTNTALTLEALTIRANTNGKAGGGGAGASETQEQKCRSVDVTSSH